MTYGTAQALRMALEQRLLSHSRTTGVALDRLRRRVVFERVVARLQAAEPGLWVLKGGMALEVRLRDRARLTKDLDLGLRVGVSTADELHERLAEALGKDPAGDRFLLTVSPVRQLMEDGAGEVTWRSQIGAQLAGRPFGRLQLDVSPRLHELDDTDLVPLPNSLEFAGVTSPEIEIIEVDRHAAEKLHAMLKDFGDRENTRVRDLVDLVILCEQRLLDPCRLAAAARRVWSERDGVPPPASLPPFAGSWPDRYERLVAEHDLRAASFPAAVAVVTALWTEMFSPDES
jgi:hypothetical protein